MNEFFSDDLPVLLPVWHSVQSSNKKFSRLRNQFDLDIVPDYGGHMFYYDKRTEEFKQIKHDILGKSPFVIRSHLTPYRISLESTDDVPNNKNTNRCLVCDQNQLITTVSFNHPKKKELLIQYLDLVDQNELENDKICLIEREYFDSSYGNIEQVNKFVNSCSKIITHVRQERCINILNFKKSSFPSNNQWSKISKIVLQNPNEFFFYSDHNTILGEYLIAGSSVDNQVKINEIDIEPNTQIWSISFEQVNRGFQINYSKYHPRMFYLTTSNDINIFDTRYKSTTGNLIVSRNKLKSSSSIERFRQFSNSISNSNYLLVATDYNLMLFDVRYPNNVLMQWSHMLSNNSEVSFINCLKLEVDTVFIGSREEISCISIDKPCSSNLIQPTSLHFPIHLPKLKDMIKNSTVVDLRLEQYINRSKIVGLDFVQKNKDFDLYLMNQYGDLFKQKLSKTDLKNSNEIIMQLEANSKTKLDYNLNLFKVKLLEQRRNEVKNKNFFETSKLKAGHWKPGDRTYWSKFIDDLNLSAYDITKQEIDCQKNEFDTNSLIKYLKEINLTNAEFVTKLKNVFKENTKDFVSNDISHNKWNEYTLQLFEAWNLKQDEPTNRLNDDYQKAIQTSQNLTQDYILSQYI